MTVEKSCLGIRILGIVGSMRKGRNTFLVVNAVLKAAEKVFKDVKTKIVYVSDFDIGSCKACYDECSLTPYKCVIKDDLQKIFEEMINAYAVVLGSSRYFLIPSKFVAFAERLACLSYFTEQRHPGFKHPLEDKPCGLVAVSGGDDVKPVLRYLQDFALC